MFLSILIRSFKPSQSLNKDVEAEERAAEGRGLVHRVLSCVCGGSSARTSLGQGAGFSALMFQSARFPKKY